jgi:uncharacterized protein DUF1569
MKSIFEEEVYDEIITRVNKLAQDSKGQWGKMNVGQMVWHCQIPLKVAVKNKKLRITGNPLIRWFFKKSLYNDKPWRKNLPTASYAKAKEDKEFASENEVLKKLIYEIYALRKREVWNPHPLFGTFTPQQWGQMQYKHLDHHLRQFGV